MSENLRKYELIDRYLNNELVGRELEDFEHRLNSDLSFREDLESVRISNEIIFDKGLLELKAKIKNFDPSSVDGTKNNFLKGKNGWILGASTVVLIVSSLLYYNSEKSTPEISSGVTPNNNVTELPVSKINPADNSVTQNHQTVLSDAKENISKSNSPTGDHTPTKKNENKITEENTSGFKQEEKTEHSEGSPNVKEKTSEAEIVHDQKPANIAAVDCVKIKITAHHKVTETCQGQQTGRIAFDPSSIKGGTKPYEYSIDGGINFQHLPVFNNLAADEYNLMIREKDDCKSQVEKIILKAKNCEEQKEQAFSPDHGQIWEIPLNGHTDAEIKIFSPSGGIVYHVFIKDGYPNTWDGNNLPMGSYSYLLTSKGELISKGFVTIIK